jgi:hypothetical protein
VSGPGATGEAGSLVGPFTVSTNQATVTLSSSPALTFTDSSGAAVDPASVMDGQQVYLDLRGTATSGTAIVTATADGASGTGLVISTPAVGSTTATPESHRQSLILVAAADASTAASASAAWAAAAIPTIGTTLSDAADEDHVLAWSGGTLVDRIAYSGLTPGVEYTVSGELMVRADGSATGLTGRTTFTPATADGTVEVTFTVPAGYASQTLVAFETLYEGGSATGTPVADHKDIDDVNQTVTVAAQPTTTAPIGTAPAGASPSGTAPISAGLASTGGALPVGMTTIAVIAVLLGMLFLLGHLPRRAAR